MKMIPLWNEYYSSLAWRNAGNTEVHNLSSVIRANEWTHYTFQCIGKLACESNWWDPSPGFSPNKVQRKMMFFDSFGYIEEQYFNLNGANTVFCLVRILSYLRSETFSSLSSYVSMLGLVCKLPSWAYVRIHLRARHSDKPPYTDVIWYVSWIANSQSQHLAADGHVYAMLTKHGTVCGEFLTQGGNGNGVRPLSV
jgi:hypothetical protein